MGSSTLHEEGLEEGGGRGGGGGRVPRGARAAAPPSARTARPSRTAEEEASRRDGPLAHPRAARPRRVLLRRVTHTHTHTHTHTTHTLRSHTADTDPQPTRATPHTRRARARRDGRPRMPDADLRPRTRRPTRGRRTRPGTAPDAAVAVAPLGVGGPPASVRPATGAGPAVAPSGAPSGAPAAASLAAYSWGLRCGTHLRNDASTGLLDVIRAAGASCVPRLHVTAWRTGHLCHRPHGARLPADGQPALRAPRRRGPDDARRSAAASPRSSGCSPSCSTAACSGGSEGGSAATR